jgi:phosphatidylinositol alpha-1,6-mannosyltransferase
MNILFFAYDFERGGMARHSREVAEGLGRLGHRVFVVSDFEGGAPTLAGDEAFVPVSFPKRNLRSPSFWTDFVPFRSLTKKLSIEMLLLAALFPYGPMALLLSRSTGIPFSIIVHGAELFVEKRKTKLIVSRIFAGAKKIICVSRFTRDALLRRFPKSPIPVVIHPGTHPEVFVPAVDREALLEKYGLKGRRVLLSVSRLVRRKGHAQTIRALPKVLERAPQTVYWIAGSGPAEEGLRALVRDMRLEEHVRFLGSVDDEELVDLYAMCDLFVLPSMETTDTESGSLRLEGFGIVFLEAAACGRPVVAGRSGGSVEAVLDGVTGLLVEGEDVEQVSEAIVKLLLDEQLAERLGRNGRARVEREFSWDAIVRAIEREICG